MRYLLLLLILGLAPAQSLRCGILSFTDKQAWSNSTTVLNTIYFDDFADPLPDTDRSYRSGLSQYGVTFSGLQNSSPSSYLQVRSARPAVGAPSFLYGLPTGPACFTTCQNAGPGTGINIVLPANTTSVSWDFANFYRTGAFGYTYTNGLEVDFSDGTVYTNTYAGAVFPWLGGSQFIGFTSSQPITSLLIMGGGYPTVQNFSFGTALPASSTPEPTTLSSLLVGTLIALIVRTRSNPPRKQVQ